MLFRLAADIINNKTNGIDLPFASTEGLPRLGGAKIEIIAADHQGSPGDWSGRGGAAN